MMEGWRNEWFVGQDNYFRQSTVGITNAPALFSSDTPYFED